MRKNKELAFNTNLIFFAALFVVFIVMAISFLVENAEESIACAIGCFIISAAPLFAIVISPIFYIFDSEKVTLLYCVGIREQISWKEIRSITKDGGWFRGSGKGMPTFEISYPKRRKYPFFVNSNITRNRKTTNLIKKYYKQQIRDL